MKEYLKRFIFFIIVCIAAAGIFRMVFPKTINVRIIGPLETETKVKL